MSEIEYEKVERLTDPDPFAVARAVSSKLKAGCACEALDGLKYLWIYFSKNDAPPAADAVDPIPPMALEDWLNVVDEAASLGVTALVISSQKELSKDCHAWEILRWAQEAHSMTVGLHVFSENLSAPALERIRELDLDRFFLFAAESKCDGLKSLERDGIRVRVAEGGPQHPHDTCSMPSAMLFVNPGGHIYTCGMVEGKEAFRMGNALSGYFSKLLQDPSLPHAVPHESQDVTRGCEGCPPLIARQVHEL